MSRSLFHSPVNKIFTEELTLGNAAHLIDTAEIEFVSSIRVEVQTHALSDIGWIKLGDEGITIARLVKKRIVGIEEVVDAEARSGLAVALHNLVIVHDARRIIGRRRINVCSGVSEDEVIVADDVNSADVFNSRISGVANSHRHGSFNIHHCATSLDGATIVTDLRAVVNKIVNRDERGD